MEAKLKNYKWGLEFFGLTSQEWIESAEPYKDTRKEARKAVKRLNKLIKKYGYTDRPYRVIKVILP